MNDIKNFIKNHRDISIILGVAALLFFMLIFAGIASLSSPDKKGETKTNVYSSKGKRVYVDIACRKGDQNCRDTAQQVVNSLSERFDSSSCLSFSYGGYDEPRQGITTDGSWTVPSIYTGFGHTPETGKECLANFNSDLSFDGSGDIDFRHKDKVEYYEKIENSLWKQMRSYAEFIVPFVEKDITRKLAESSYGGVEDKSKEYCESISRPYSVVNDTRDSARKVLLNCLRFSDVQAKTKIDAWKRSGNICSTYFTAEKFIGVDGCAYIRSGSMQARNGVGVISESLDKTTGIGVSIFNCGHQGCINELRDKTEGNGWNGVVYLGALSRYENTIQIKYDSPERFC